MSIMPIVLTIFFIFFMGICWYYLMLSIPTSMDKTDEYKKLLDAYAHKCNEVKELREEIFKLEDEINKLKK